MQILYTLLSFFSKLLSFVIKYCYAVFYDWLHNNTKLINSSIDTLIKCIY